jgi:hypothetical protein
MFIFLVAFKERVYVDLSASTMLNDVMLVGGIMVKNFGFLNAGTLTAGVCCYLYNATNALLSF